MRKLPQRGYGISLLRILAVLVALFVVVGVLFFPAQELVHPGPKRVSAENDCLQLKTAIKAFYTEYGRFPRVVPNGRYETKEANAALIKALQAKDPGENSRKIMFFEARMLEKKERSRYSGIDPESGAFLDPWGNFYRVRIDSNYEGKVRSPYSDDENPTFVHQQVIVWSLGKDGKQGPQPPNSGEGSDDIMSWN